MFFFFFFVFIWNPWFLEFQERERSTREELRLLIQVSLNMVSHVRCFLSYFFFPWKTVCSVVFWFRNKSKTRRNWLEGCRICRRSWFRPMNWEKNSKGRFVSFYELWTLQSCVSRFTLGTAEAFLHICGICLAAEEMYEKKLPLN